MKTLLIPAVAATLLAGAAAPALAAPGQNLNAQQARIEQRIEVGVRNHTITRREAATLRAELRQIERLEARYRHDGLSRRERADLSQRLDRLSAKVFAERHDRQNRYGYGYGDRHDYYRR